MRVVFPSKRVRMPLARTINGFPQAAVINRLMTRGLLAGRDVPVVTTRATGRVGPSDLAVLGNNVPSIAYLSIGGWQVPMYGAFDTRTNLVTSQNVGGAAWYNEGNTPTVSTITGPNATIPTGYNISGGNRGFGFGTLNGTYVLSAWIQNSGEYLRFRRGSGGFNTFGQINAGANWARVSTIVVPDGASIFELYTSSNLNVAGIQLELAPCLGPYIPTAGTAVTHNADQHVWTPSTGFSNGVPAEAVAFESPYGWSAAAGAPHPNGTNRIFDLGTVSTDGLNRAAGTGKDSFFASSTVNSAESLPEVSGQVRMISVAWDGTNSAVYQRNVGGTPGALTLNAQTFARLGNRSTVDAAWSGYVGMLYVPGGLTTAERIALGNLTPQTLAYAA